MGLERVPQLVDILGDYTWEEIFGALDAIMENHMDKLDDAGEHDAYETMRGARNHIANADIAIWGIE